MKLKVSLNAKSFRIVLLIVMLLLVIGAVGGFIFARNKLETFASSISQMEADASQVDGNIEALKKLQVSLKDTQDITAKVNAITVPASDYPVAVIGNVTAIAKRSGVKLSSVNYGESADTPTAQTPPSGTGTPPAITPQTTQEAPVPAGVTKKTVNVVVESPVDYTAVMNFIKNIETDNMYMHINRITLTKAEGTSVTLQPLAIEVYTK